MGESTGNNLADVLPQFFPAHWLDEAPDIVHTEFPSRIRVGYVQRSDGSYSYVMRPELDEASVSIEALHEAAIRNLDAMAGIALTIGQTPGGPEAFLKEANDNFQAVRILLPRVHRAFAQELGDEYFAAIPCRDWFICWSKDQEPKRQERNIRQARTDFLEDEYNLTPDILLRSATGFSVHLTQEPEA